MNEHDLTLYRGLIAERDKEIKLLQQAVVHFGDRGAMSFAEPPEVQQAIDRAFENHPRTETEDPVTKWHRVHGWDEHG